MKEREDKRDILGEIKKKLAKKIGEEDSSLEHLGNEIHFDSSDVIEIGYIKVAPFRHLVFSLQNWKGRKWFDIRECFKNEDTGKWTPTKRGVHISSERFKEFFKCVEKLKDAIEKD